MSEFDAYVGRVRGLLISIADRLTPRECGEVEHLIEHGEPAEAMRALAWIVVERRLKVPAKTVAELRDLTAGLIEDEHMPPDLDECIEA
jgi:hypothetical protein